MEPKSISEIKNEYELELNRIINAIKKQKAKKILLQFPEGLKPYSIVIAKEIEKKADCDCFVWLDTCFGACDIPLETEKLGIDLIVQFGHSRWKV